LVAKRMGFGVSMERAVLVRGRIRRVGDPVVHWLGRVGVRSRPTYGAAFRLFMRWLSGRTSWLGVDASGLLVRQAEAEDPYELLDLLQEFVSGLDRGAKSKQLVYAAVKSFFMHNRCALPDDRGFRIRGTKPPVVPRLSLNDVSNLVRAAGLRDRSILLVKWQAMLDNERTSYVGQRLTDQVVSQIKAGTNPVRLDLPGRKSEENIAGYYTFIGKDAADALVAYFEKERGWPRQGDPIWLEKTRSGKQKPFTTSAFACMWLRLTRRIGLVPKRKGIVGSRYGYNAHEMRDIAKSLLHTSAKAQGFDMDCCEFWLGHKVDPLGYDKFHNDQEYVRKQYLIAEKYLNIISTPPASEEARRQEEEISALKQRLTKMEQFMGALQGQVTGSIRQLERQG